MKQSGIFHSQRRVKNSKKDFHVQKKIFLIMTGFIFLALSLALAADIPMMLNYQGYVEYDDGVPLNGEGNFKFAIVNKEGDTTTTSWLNNGTSTTGDELDNAVKIPVTNGVFTVKLGDTDMTNMSALPSTVFDQQNIYVRVWFSDDNITFEQLAPDTQIVSAGFAYKAHKAQIAENLSGVTLGIPGGIATLDENGKIPNAQLPGIAVDSAGNIGIGTTYTAYSLDVYRKSDGLTGRFNSGSTGNFLDLSADAGQPINLGFYKNGVGRQGFIKYDLGTDKMSFRVNYVERVTIDKSGNVGIGTKSPEAKLHVATDSGDGQAFIRASNFNPVPTAYWPGFDETSPYLLRNALWVGWDDSKKAWKYTRKSDNDRGVTDPGDPATWVVNGEDTGYFDGDLDALPPGAHMNNRYNPRMMACRCNQDDIQVKVGSFWIDKYACRIIDVGQDYKGATWKDDTADMQTSANADVSPFWMAFSQRARASTGMTWFVAAQASVNAGKQLPGNAEWQASALGTARSTGNEISGGSDWSTIDVQDVSRYGVIGMAGNVWEWVADWIQAGKTWQTSDGQSAAPWPSDKGYGDDYTYNINGRAYNGSSWVDGAPAAPFRGGYWSSGSYAGVFAVNANHAPSYWSYYIGFRSVR